MTKKEDDKELMKSLASAGESVLATGILAGGGAWGGMLLDTRLHSSPWFAVGLAILGLSLGLARMVVKALQSEKK